jgi:hypothetical protein
LRSDGAERVQNALLQSLSRWPGRRATQAAIEQRGFLLHRGWQERTIDFCGRNDAELEQYWDEFATEWVSCAGHCNPDARVFPIAPIYRSSHLDELVARMDFADPSYRGPPLRCLYEYKRAHHDRAFVSNETAYFELKELEIRKFSISSEGLTDQKRSILPFVEKFTATRGFSALKRRFVKRSPDLIFEIKSDFGWNPLLGAGLPLDFRIYHKTAPDFALVINNTFDFIVPGFSRYEYCPDPNGCILAIFACVELFDVMSIQLANPAADLS